MIRDTLAKIEQRIADADALPESNKKELKGLVSDLKAELQELAKTRAEHAESISGFAHVSAHEATRREQNPALLKLSVDGLSSSVEGFESSHPKLVQTVNSICMMLSNLGI